MAFFLLRKMMSNEHGQAIILAALGLLVMTLGVLATINIGDAVYQKIKLQNMADSVAYSTSTLQARALNYISFVNRAQVFHYVSMMSFQTYLSFMMFLEAGMAVMSEFFHNLNVLCNTCKCTKYICSAIPYIGQTLPPVLSQISLALQLVISAIGAIIDVFDAFIGGILIPALYYINWAMWASQIAMLEAVVAQVATSLIGLELINTIAKKYLKKDPGLDMDKTSYLTLALNMFAWNNIFDPAGGTPITPVPKLPGMKSSDPGVKRAQRLMAEIANATRYNEFLTSRTLSQKMKKIINNPFSGSIKIEKKGQTKMVTRSSTCAGNIHNCIRKNDASGVYMHDGSQMAADDTLKLKYGNIFMRLILFVTRISRRAETKGDAVSVKAAPDGQGEHCRFDKWGKGRCVGIIIPCLCFKCRGFLCIKGMSSCCSGCNEKKAHYKCAGDAHNHPWHGIAPYLKFKPNPDPNKNFGQPSVYIWLNRSPKRLKKAFTMQIKYSDSTGSSSLDMTTGRQGLANQNIFKGVNAISRAMVYYHRPGNWQEAPNFFNPFWRSRLAPIGDTISQVLNMVAGLPSGFSRFVLDNIITH